MAEEGKYTKDEMVKLVQAVDHWEHQYPQYIGTFSNEPSLKVNFRTYDGDLDIDRTCDKLAEIRVEYDTATNVAEVRGIPFSEYNKLETAIRKKIGADMKQSKERDTAIGLEAIKGILSV
jgi:hypothetical protein